MKFVLRALKKNAASKTKKINGIIHYEFPIVTKNKDGEEQTFHVYIPKHKTYFSSSNSLCVCLDDENIVSNNLIKEDFNSSLTDKQLLKILSNDYIAYMASNKYNPALSHSMNTFMPVGILEESETNEVIINKWTSACDTINHIYGDKLTCIEPFTCNSLYPFHYQKFAKGEFIREYRSNVMMFILYIDKNFVLSNEKKFDNNQYIYYKLKDRYYPFFRMITDEQFYESCLVKDVKNFKKTPFLKSFNDQGVCKELIEFIKEDDVFRTNVVTRYNEIRNEMKLTKKDKNRYFIPAMDDSVIDILRKIKMGLKVTASEREIYNQAYQNRIKTISENFFDKNKRFFFSYDDLEDEHLLINSAQKRYIESCRDYTGYDYNGNIIYTYDNESSGVTPLLEAITKEELDKLKDEVYNYWISTKYYKK